MPKRIMLVFFLLGSLFAAYSQAIDLTRSTVFLRKGFSLEWVFDIPSSGDTNWINIRNTGSKSPFISIRNFEPKRTISEQFFSFKKPDAKRYCVIIPFFVNDTMLQSRTGLGLYLAAIGQNWQIYLNGHLLRDANYTSTKDKIEIERSVRGTLIPIDTRHLNAGKNLLSFMISCDAYNQFSGLTAQGPYLIDEYAKLNSMRNETLKLILIGIYFFFSLYHTILYLLSPKTKAYLYFGIAAGLLAFFLLSRTFIVYDIILDTHIIYGLELASLFLLVPAFIAFFDASLNKKVSMFGRIYTVASAIISVLQFFFWQELFMLVWLYIVVVPVLYIIVIDIGLPIVKAAMDQKTTSVNRFMKRVLKVLVDSDDLRLLAIILFMVVAITLDLSAFGDDNTVSHSDYAYLVLIFGTAASLSAQILKAFHQNEALNIELADRVNARQQELEKTLSAQAALNVNLSETKAKLEVSVEAAIKDMQIATRMQQSFFPNTPPRTKDWEVAFIFMPASGVSGDFYDFFVQNEKLDGLVVGDVSGHGIAPGLITVLSRSIFYRNFYANKDKTLGRVLDIINAELIPELESIDNYLTAAIMRFTPEGGVEYSSAGHTEVLYKGAKRLRAIPLRPKDSQTYRGPPLGKEAFVSSYSSMRFKLATGDVMLIYTDGLDEAKNIEGHQFGVDGVAAALTAAPEGDAGQKLDFIVREWRFHSSGTKIADDVAAVLIKKL